MDRPVDDLTARARIRDAAIKLSVFVFRDQVSKALGEDITSPAGYARIGQGLMEVFTIPLVTPEQAEQLRKRSEEK